MIIHPERIETTSGKISARRVAALCVDLRFDAGGMEAERGRESSDAGSDHYHLHRRTPDARMWAASRDQALYVIRSGSFPAE